MENEILKNKDKAAYTGPEERIFLNDKEKPFVFDRDKRILEELAKTDSYLRGLLSYDTV